MPSSIRVPSVLRLAVVIVGAVLLLGVAAGITHGQAEPRPQSLTSGTFPEKEIRGRHVTLSDWVIQPMQELTISVQGYAPDEPLTVLLYAPATGEKVRLAEVIADAQGQAQLDVTIPAAWPYGIMTSQRRQVLRVEDPNGARDLAELSLVDGPAVEQVPAIVDQVLLAMRANDVAAVSLHLTGAALEQVQSTGGDVLSAITGLDRRVDEITGIGSRLTRLAAGEAQAEAVLILGQDYVRLTVDLQRVNGEYRIEAFHVQGLYR